MSKRTTVYNIEFTLLEYHVTGLFHTLGCRYSLLHVVTPLYIRDVVNICSFRRATWQTAYLMIVGEKQLFTIFSLSLSMKNQYILHIVKFHSA